MLSIFYVYIIYILSIYYLMARALQRQELGISESRKINAWLFTIWVEDFYFLNPLWSLFNFSLCLQREYGNESGMGIKKR